jgi:hypothetical protein
MPSVPQPRYAVLKQNAMPEPVQSSIRYDRRKDLRVAVFQGDLLVAHPRLKELDFEMVSFIEVIEHLPPEAIPQANSTIFGYLRPQYVVVTTPNHEFNVHFRKDSQHLRHWDHKFEWTRQ